MFRKSRNHNSVFYNVFRRRQLLSMPVESELRCCSPFCCSAPLCPPSSPASHKDGIQTGRGCVIYKGRDWNHKGNQGILWTNLRQGRFVDTVNVGFGFFFNYLSESLVADCTVDHRLHERTQTTRHWQVTTGSRPLRHILQLSNGCGNQAKLTLSFLKRHAEESTVPLWHLVALR